MNDNENLNVDTVEVPESIKSDETNLNQTTFEYDMNDYTNKANTETKSSYTVRTISATSKVSVQLNDVWYAFSFSETRDINDDSNMSKERADLWDKVNAEVDNQVQYVIDTLKNPGLAQQ